MSTYNIGRLIIYCKKIQGHRLAIYVMAVSLCFSKRFQDSPKITRV